MNEIGRQSNELVDEISIIRDAVDCYFQGNFEAMKRLIQEYGEKDFFTDLFVLFESETWRKSVNKYYTYVGIVRQFFKIYS